MNTECKQKYKTFQCNWVVLLAFFWSDDMCENSQQSEGGWKGLVVWQKEL